MTSEMNRRNFLKVAAGAVASVPLTSDAVAQQVTRSPERPGLRMIGSEQGVAPEYIAHYEGWISELVTKNQVVMKEIASISRGPVDTGDQYSELVFSREDGSLPEVIEIIRGRGERVIMHIYRDPGSPDGEVYIVAETYVPLTHRTEYESRGIRIDGVIGQLGRILKASVAFQTRGNTFRPIND